VLGGAAVVLAAALAAPVTGATPVPVARLTIPIPPASTTPASSVNNGPGCFMIFPAFPDPPPCLVTRRSGRDGSTLRVEKRYRLASATGEAWLTGRMLPWDGELAG